MDKIEDYVKVNMFYENDCENEAERNRKTCVLIATLSILMRWCIKHGSYGQTNHDTLSVRSAPDSVSGLGQSASRLGYKRLLLPCSTQKRAESLAKEMSAEACFIPLSQSVLKPEYDKFCELPIFPRRYGKSSQIRKLVEGVSMPIYSGLRCECPLGKALDDDNGGDR